MGPEILACLPCLPGDRTAAADSEPPAGMVIVARLFFPPPMCSDSDQRTRAIMIKRLLHRWCLPACFAIVAGFFFAAPSSLSAARPARARRQVCLRVNLHDTGRTVALSVGQQLIVTLPLYPSYDDNYWVCGPQFRPEIDSGT